jgi:ABC-type nitrate/sulfonate/bicarbonate transport system substrate-binding protein
MLSTGKLAVTNFRCGNMTISRHWLPQRFRGLLLAPLVVVFLSAQTPSALAGQAKPLVKVVIGYGSADGGVAVLGFAKEAKLFEKYGLDVVLVGMGTGSVSLRALIAKDLQISSLSGSGLVQAALQGADTVLIAALVNGFSARRKYPLPCTSKARN